MKDGKKKGKAGAATKKGGAADGGTASEGRAKAQRVAEGTGAAIKEAGGATKKPEEDVEYVAVSDQVEPAVGKGEVPAGGLTLEEATKKLENLRRTIRKLLNEQGKYRKELTYQVEVAASTLLAWRKVRDEAITVKRIVLKETSREGDERWKAHPIFEMYAKMTDVLRRDLRALQMNKEREKALEDDGEGGDGLTELMAALGEE